LYIKEFQYILLNREPEEFDWNLMISVDFFFIINTYSFISCFSITIIDTLLFVYLVVFYTLNLWSLTEINNISIYATHAVCWI